MANGKDDRDYYARNKRPEVIERLLALRPTRRDVGGLITCCRIAGCKACASIADRHNIQREEA